MIIKILEEMSNLKLKKDYRNYRNLSKILYDTINMDILRDPKIYKMNSDEFYKIGFGKLFFDVMTILIKEINNNNEALNISLSSKDYIDFKLISQTNITLKYLLERLTEIKNRIIPNGFDSDLM